MPGGRRRATYLMCAKALCQEKEYEPRILRVPRLMPAIQSKKKKRRRRRATYLTCVKAICLEEEEEEGDSQRVVLDPHVMENLT